MLMILNHAIKAYSFKLQDSMGLSRGTVPALISNLRPYKVPETFIVNQLLNHVSFKHVRIGTAEHFATRAAL